MRVRDNKIQLDLDLDAAWWIYEHLPSDDKWSKELVDTIIKLELEMRSDKERQSREPKLRVVVYETHN